jgi:hypothetical protein
VLDDLLVSSRESPWGRADSQACPRLCSLDRLEGSAIQMLVAEAMHQAFEVLSSCDQGVATDPVGLLGDRIEFRWNATGRRGRGGRGRGRGRGADKDFKCDEQTQAAEKMKRPHFADGLLLGCALGTDEGSSRGHSRKLCGWAAAGLRAGHRRDLE